MQHMKRLYSGAGQARVLLACLLAASMIILPGAAEARGYPKLFGSYELYSARIARFPQWVAMLARFRQEAAGCETATCSSAGWTSLISSLKGKPLDRQLREVNDLFNAHRYVLDGDNWREAEYWATPYEFLRKSGDCEDFAVAKYMALKALGVPVEDLRIVVVWDTKSASGHAALVVYVADDAFLLDNLIPAVVRADSVDHYRAIYSINEKGWWLHRVLTPQPAVEIAAVP